MLRISNSIHLHQTGNSNKAGYNISNCMWTVNRKGVIAVVSGVVIKKVMISVKITAIFAIQM